MIESELSPIPVHVVSQPAAEKSKPRRKAVSLHSIQLNVTNPVQQLLGKSPNRCEAYVIQHGDKDIVLCESESDAIQVSQAADYSRNAAGTIIPKTFTGVVPCSTTDLVWVTANSTDIAAGPILVGIVEITYAED
jgi:hypothetical protein